MSGLRCMATGFHAASVGQSRNKCRQWSERHEDNPIATIQARSASVPTRKTVSESPFVTAAIPPHKFVARSRELLFKDLQIL